MYLNKGYLGKKTPFCHNNETFDCASTLNAYPPNLKKSQTLKLPLGCSVNFFGYIYLPYIDIIFFFFKFSQPSEKKGLTNATKDFFLNTKNSPYVDGKNLEVPKFRQCVFTYHQNYARLPKKYNVPLGQLPFIFN
jgi:hypothetical protein